MRTWAVFLLAGSVLAQAPADPVIRVTVDLVQVDAVVTDAKGSHITDLKPEDFEILEDGKPQKITNFSWIDVTPPKIPVSAAGAPPARNLQQREVHRSIVLMIDDLGTPWEFLPGVMASAKKFVAEQMAPGDLVSVTASRGGMGFYQQFTSDKQQLYAAIDHIAHRPGFGQWVLDPPRGMPPLATDRGEPPLGYRDASNPPNPIGYLTWAIQGLRDVPGRKAVVLFSHGFFAPQSVVNLANRSGVVIYVLDPTGQDAAGRVIPADAPYRRLAEQTGGLWIKSLIGKELNADLSEVLEDMSGYYLIGYKPDRSDFELAHGTPVHHDIQVKVRRPGLVVRSRNGFMGVPDPRERPAPKTREDYLQQALFSPFAATGIRLRLDAVYGAGAPDPKKKKRLPVVRAMLSIEGGDLKFTDGPEGKKTLTLDALVGVFNQDGTPAGSADQRFTISADAAAAANLMKYGLHLSKDVNLPRPGPYLVRAAVREEAASAVGSAYSFVEAPDFDGSQIALSSIVLSTTGDENAKNRDYMGWGQFAAGTTVHFGAELFGVKNSKPPKKPDVEMQVLLFRDGDAVYKGDLIPLAPEEIAENLLAGRLNLAKEMPAGDYSMQLIAYDREASKKKQMATQWIDLTVVKP
ncbi:MAG TPA: VWA domain-containing protein [Bryobacteraceae bacterium]|nr:VWA domain-containing protein [Bryobacteraceae bacterium]